DPRGRRASRIRRRRGRRSPRPGARDEDSRIEPQRPSFVQVTTMQKLWKVATCALALSTGVLAMRTGPRPAAPPVAAKVCRVPARAPERSGGDEASLLAALESTNNAVEIAALCEKLGLVGSERALPALARLAEDPRVAVAEAAVAALGAIGGDDATE